MNNFYNVLFDLGESTCFSANPYGVQVSRVFAETEHTEQFFCINPLKSRRKDANVTAYRNFLVEFDGVPLDQQRNIVNMAKLPFSTCVFSGSKSFHFIISLETPVATIEEYKAITRRLHAYLPEMDKSTSNPSRFSRTPNAIRENGNRQDVMEIRTRVPNDHLLGLLPPDTKVELPPIDLEGKKRLRILTPFTNYYLNFGEVQNRNMTLFRVACDMFKAGYSQDEILHKIANVNTLPIHETLTCIRSAYKTVRPEL